MKKYLMILFAVLTMATNANAMSYEQARSEALFLTDKMAYELNLTDAQYEAAYEINLDYLMSVTGRNDVFGHYWECRNLDLSHVLYSWQWELFRAASYFYRPLYWDAGFWHFGIYARYPRRDYFYFGRPHFYASYRGGHSWRTNSGRSYYEGHRGVYRPHENYRDRHVGMRDGWDRGDYHGRGGSSTRVTGGHHRDYRPGGNDGRTYRDNNGGRTYRDGGNRDNNSGRTYRDGGNRDNNSGRSYRDGSNHNNNGSGRAIGTRPQQESRSFGNRSAETRGNRSMGSTPRSSGSSRSSNGSIGAHRDR